MMRVLRLLENYVSDTVDPATNEPIKFDKRYLLLEVAPRKDGWVLIKTILEKNVPPVWISERLVEEAQPGFYRARNDINRKYGGKLLVKAGDYIKVLDVEPRYYKNMWSAVKLDGRGAEVLCDPAWLEVTDVPDQPPGSRPSSPTPLKSIFGSFKRLRRQTFGASDNPPPPYDYSSEEDSDIKS